MNKIETARSVLTGPGKWTKEKFHSPNGVRHCLLGAMYGLDAEISTATDPDIEALAEVIREQYPERIGWNGRVRTIVVDFNDHSETTFEDVDRVLDKALVKSRELI